MASGAQYTDPMMTITIYAVAFYFMVHRRDLGFLVVPRLLVRMDGRGGSTVPRLLW